MFFMEFPSIFLGNVEFYRENRSDKVVDHTILYKDFFRSTHHSIKCGNLHNVFSHRRAHVGIWMYVHGEKFKGAWSNWSLRSPIRSRAYCAAIALFWRAVPWKYILNNMRIAEAVVDLFCGAYIMYFNTKKLHSTLTTLKWTHCGPHRVCFRIANVEHTADC